MSSQDFGFVLFLASRSREIAWQIIYSFAKCIARDAINERINEKFVSDFLGDAAAK